MSREIVIDASAIIAVIANEPETAALIELTKGADLLAPLSIPWEIGNAFSAMLKRRPISVEHAGQAIEIYHTIPIRLLKGRVNRILGVGRLLVPLLAHPSPNDCHLTGTMLTHLASAQGH